MTAAIVILFTVTGLLLAGLASLAWACVKHRRDELERIENGAKRILVLERRSDDADKRIEAASRKRNAPNGLRYKWTIDPVTLDWELGKCDTARQMIDWERPSPFAVGTAQTFQDAQRLIAESILDDKNRQHIRIDCLEGEVTL